MGKIITNRHMGEDFYLLTVEANEAARTAEPGQFCMLRTGGPGEDYPLLSRPISIFDAGKTAEGVGTLSFLYKKVGKGTDLLTRKKPGEELELRGPFGHGFPKNVAGRVALVGGGVGIAPLHLYAKYLRNAPAVDTVDIYLGYSGSPILQEAFEAQADRLRVNIGGFVTDDVSPMPYDAIITCGPEIMMRVLYRKCMNCGAGSRLWVSMEKRMACGIGICKVCTCFTADGTKTACKDGPVFRADEVFYDERERMEEEMLREAAKRGCGAEQEADA